MRDTRNNPSYTWWLLTRPFHLIGDTFKTVHGIAGGQIPLPGRKFYFRLLGGIAVCVLAMAAYTVSPYKLVYNYTESEVVGWYLLHEVSEDFPLERNDMIMVDYLCPRTAAGDCPFDEVVHYRDGANLIKRVQGLPGDNVYSEIHDGALHKFVSYGGKVLDRGAVLEETSAGKAMPVVFSPGPEGVIPKHKFYIGNQLSEKAFDSRYFGYVDRAQVIGLVKKL